MEEEKLFKKIEIFGWKSNSTYRSGFLLLELGWMNPIGLQTLQLTNEVPGESLQQKMHFSRGLHNKKKVVYFLTRIDFKKTPVLSVGTHPAFLCF